MGKTTAVAKTNTAASTLIEALNAGANPEQLQAIQDAVTWADKRAAESEFNSAFTKAQAEFPSIYQSGVVDFTTNKGRTHYTYAKFSDIVAAVRPVLTKHGFSFRHEVKTEGSAHTVSCIIAHKAGHSVTTTLVAGNDKSGNKNDHQAVASAVTYLKRYTLEAALGLTTTDDDDDAQAYGAPSQIETITDEQSIDLMDALEKHPKPDVLFTKIKLAYGIDGMLQLPADKFEECLTRIENAVAAAEEK